MFQLVSHGRSQGTIDCIPSRFQLRHSRPKLRLTKTTNNSMGEIFPLCKVLILLVINFMKRFSNGSLFTANWSSRRCIPVVGPLACMVTWIICGSSMLGTSDSSDSTDLDLLIEAYQSSTDGMKVSLVPPENAVCSLDSLFQRNLPWISDSSSITKLQYNEATWHLYL